ncbi:MAG: hypothetical protein HN396_15120 [Gemmatimonadales bacterium]|jgi:hypothetical protein|nr:hypothetical protein [Gemmatimonadales bacterium]MDG2239928.1 hypothetical protein [Longimicrobiales bacterium]NCG31465.1 hypothetical protein [Pseudomonadota bacterium]MBT3499208.1 hypothetical protein [Gemmatimonadales bacterium]MBT3773809.1 hypothetical protein [Gemmatimonadales bacterium]
MYRALLLISLLLSGCSDVVRQVVPLDELVLQDSIYMDAETLEPFTGRVERVFEDDPREVQLRGDLVNGMWNGDIIVYHENGRIRYMGSLADGEKCGEWIENRDSDPPSDILAELKQEIESLGIYEPCPER